MKNKTLIEGLKAVIPYNFCLPSLLLLLLLLILLLGFVKLLHEHDNALAHLVFLLQVLEPTVKTPFDEASSGKSVPCKLPFHQDATVTQYNVLNLKPKLKWFNCSKCLLANPTQISLSKIHVAYHWNSLIFLLVVCRIKG